MIGENWLKVALTAMALGVGLYIIPLAMIANPALIGLIEAPGAALFAFARVALGLALVSHGLIGARGMAARAGMLGAGGAVCASGLLL